MARPRTEIDETEFQKLCSIQCTLGEIAAWFKCSEDTIERWCKRELKMSFADAYKIFSVDGKISLRRTQFKMANHNVSMAIWLGKQYLGQTETVQVDQSEVLSKLDNMLAGVKEAAVKDGEEEADKS